MILSVLVTTDKNEEAEFNQLHESLIGQIKEGKYQKEVEIIYFEDYSGKNDTNTKRYSLLRQATGKYVSFIRAKDTIAGNYIKKIVEALKKKKPDCVGLVGSFKNKKTGIGQFILSTAFSFDDAYEKKNAICYGLTWINPIKKEIADTISFYGDSKLIEKQLAEGSIKTEAFIDEPVYEYMFEEQNKPQLS